MDSTADRGENSNRATFRYKLRPIEAGKARSRGKGSHLLTLVHLAFELEARSSLGGVAYVLLVVELELERAELDAAVSAIRNELLSRDHVEALLTRLSPHAILQFAELIIANEFAQTCAVAGGRTHVVDGGGIACATRMDRRPQIDLVPPVDPLVCARCAATLFQRSGGWEALRGALVLLAAGSR